MKNTLRISFSLKMSYLVNGFLYSLKQVPLLKKILPQSLYGQGGLKALANVIAGLYEIFSALIGKAIYFAFMIFLPLIIYKTSLKSEVFLHILIALSLAGAGMNTYLFNPSKDKYYAVILLRMNAKEYAVVNYLYAELKLLVGVLIFGTLFGLMAQVPLWICLIMPFFVVSLKAIVAAHKLNKYEKAQRPVNENTVGPLGWTLMLLAIATAYIPPFINIVLPQWAAVAFMIACIVLGVFAFKRIFSFAHYKACYQQLLQGVPMLSDLMVNSVRNRNQKMISNDTAITSRRTGFEYLNELFIKRHHKLLWKSTEKIALICFCVFAIGVTACFFAPDFGKGINEFVLISLPYLTFIMYTINRGTQFTQALFINCDHSLLTYSFYKKPKFVLQLYFIRLREIIKINLLPASIIGIGLALLLYASGGTNDVLNYVGLIVTLPALSVFFSVHYLTIYYLLQPYNAGTELKSATYKVIMAGTYLVCFYLMYVKMSAIAFGLIAVAFCVIYCAIACVLIYKVAPKTFKLRA